VDNRYIRSTPRGCRPAWATGRTEARLRPHGPRAGGQAGRPRSEFIVALEQVAADKGREQAHRRRTGCAGSRRNGLPGIHSLQPEGRVSKRRVGSTRADGIDIARPGLPRNDFSGPAQGALWNFQSQAGAAVVQAACRDRKMSMRRDEW